MEWGYTIAAPAAPVLPHIDEIIDEDKELCAPGLENIGQFLNEFMVNIFVGAERTKFHLHRDLLCNRSDYFRACFLGNVKEAQQKELPLPEDNAESFELFVTWLYGTHLKKISSKDELPAYFDLSILANKLCLEHLQNQTSDHILRFYRTNPRSVDYQYLRYVYQNTSSTDEARVVPVTLAAWIVVASQTAELTSEYRDLVREGGDLAVDFMDELLLCYANSKVHRESIDVLDPQRRSNCSLHKHNSTPTCIKKPKEGKKGSWDDFSWLRKGRSVSRRRGK